MAKRRAKTIKPVDVATRLRNALAKRAKSALIDALVEFARDDRGILRQLEARFELDAPPEELVAATRQAIADATDFDERDINRNFDYDDTAYAAVKRNLGRLIAIGQPRSAMKLSLELMDRGSHQVEMSDEGLMTDDIEECPRPIIDALPACDPPAGELAACDPPAGGLAAWCRDMLKKDRVGFIRDKDLQSLRERLQDSEAS